MRTNRYGFEWKTDSRLTNQPQPSLPGWSIPDISRTPPGRSGLSELKLDLHPNLDPDWSLRGESGYSPDHS